MEMIRMRFALMALVAGIAVTAGLAFQLGVFADAASPKVGGVARAAEYQHPIFVSNEPQYKGWTRAYGGQTAWRWTGSTWRSVYVYDRTWVYAWPYSDGWSWGWTQRDGWLAFRSNKLLIRYESGFIAT
jgi:hypothetical protein